MHSLLHKIYNSNLLVFLLFLFSVTFFYGIGTDIFNVALAPGDGFVLAFPSKIFSTNLSLWNPYIQAGVPVYLNPENQSFYLPSLIIMKILPNAFGYNLSLLLHYALAGFFTFLFLKRLKLNRISAIIGGMCFAFCGFLVIHKGHLAMINAAIWLPLILYFMERYFEDKKIIFLILSAISFSASILAGYPPVSFYIGMVIFPYILFKIFSDGKFGNEKIPRKIVSFILISLIISIIAFLISAVQIFSIVETLAYINREIISYTFFAGVSFPFSSLPIFLFPLYPYALVISETSVYIGIMPLIFAFLAFIWRKKNYQIYFWSLIVIFSFLLVLGDSTPFYKIMYHVPIYNMFRIPARNGFELDFALSILAAFGINYIIRDYLSNKAKKWIKISILALGIVTFCIICFLVIQYQAISIFGLIKVNSEILYKLLIVNSIYVPLILITISAVFLSLIPKFSKKKIFWIAIVIFIFIDLFSFGHYFGNTYYNSSLIEDKNTSEVYSFMYKENDLTEIRIFPSEKDSIKKNNFDEIFLLPSKYRYFDERSIVAIKNGIYPDINVLYKINIINGYYPIGFKDYLNLTSFDVYGENDKYSDLLNNSRILSILSTKYVVTSDANKKRIIESIPTYQKNYETKDGVVIYENKNFLPRARFIEKIINVNSFNESNQILWNDSNFNPSITALVQNYKDTTLLSPGEVLKTNYQNDEITLSVKTGNNSFLVLSDTYYPGWKAYVDGKETEIYNTNGVMRGILIKGEGIHQIKFVFRPDLFYWGLFISLISFLLITIISLYLNHKSIRI